MTNPTGQAPGQGPAARLLGDVAADLGTSATLWCRRIAGLLVATMMLAMAAIGGLAWRLAQGPLDLPWVATQLEQAARAGGSPNRLTIGRASLAWEGFQRGVDHPLDVRLADVAVIDPTGERLLEAANARVTLSVAGLLQGRTLPRELDVEGLRLRLRQQQDGAITLDLGSFDSPDQAQTSSGTTLLQLLEEVSSPPQSDRSLRASSFSQLRQVRIRDAAGMLLAKDATSWRLTSPEIVVQRGRLGGLHATATLDGSVGTQTVQVKSSADMPAGSGRLQLRMEMADVVPAALAGAARLLAPLAAVDARMAVTASAEFGRGLDEPVFEVQARLGPGALRAFGGTIPLRSATLTASGTAAQPRLQLDRLEVGAPGAPATVLQGSASARRAGGRMALTISLALDQVSFADLPSLWPADLGRSGLRPWMTENITTGIARNGRIVLDLAGRDDFTGLDITAMQGGMEGQDVTVHWLRPVPPLEHGSAVLTIRDATTLDIAVAGARQATGGPQPGLAMSNGLVVITGLDVHDQYADISGDVVGPVAEVIAVLRHPRVRLLDRHPVEMRNPSGQMTGHMAITRLPLDNKVTVDDLHLRATVKATALHLGGIAAGHDMDRGAMTLEVDNDGLRARGTADLANIPSQLQVEMDFRDGGPNQVVQKVNVTGTGDVAAFAPLGLDGTDYLSGTVGVRAEMTGRRSGRGEMLVRADLTATRAEVTRLNWGKPPGRAANAEARLVLDRDRIAGIDRLTVVADGVDVLANADFVAGRITRLRLLRALLGPSTDVTGDITWPIAPKSPWSVHLDGNALDATAAFGSGGGLARTRNALPDPQEKTTDPWTLDARLRRVVLGDGRSVSGVFAHVENDGRVVRLAEISGVVLGDPRNVGDAPGQFEVSVAPQPGGRRLKVTSTDAGAVLRALDVITTMRGGQMTLAGTYDDTKPLRPLSGSTQITDFRIRDAPSVGKLLQAMSIYGLIEALRGPGLNFAELVAPFRLTGDTLELFDARAYSASLGATLKGRLDIGRHVADMQGTIVPAYFFNSLLGRIPILGRMLSPERGGGLFAATFAVRGKLDDPDVTVNPLAAVTPGFLRGLFGIFDAAPIVAPPAK
jgi:hypothetical protein